MVEVGTALLRDPQVWHLGYELRKETEMTTTRLYATLDMLVSVNWVEEHVMFHPTALAGVNVRLFRATPYGLKAFARLAGKDSNGDGVINSGDNAGRQVGTAYLEPESYE